MAGFKGGPAFDEELTIGAQVDVISMTCKPTGYLHDAKGFDTLRQINCIENPPLEQRLEQRQERTSG
jgi:hypothetical protein